ncbi:MAG: DegT/DnrJ/EryC1/StrS family aminotransferase [Rhizobiales bacterium]|nr:DegT/DnrJ/EryC1/StrS family aminotransferase [Hyphomicrobiales bacterium]
MIPFIDLGAQQRKIRASLDRRMAKVLTEGQYILGPEVDELENALTAFAGASHCISVANGTDALQIAMMALGVGPGDEVITPSFSYFATAETVAILGARPVFVDIDPVSYLVQAGAIADAITSRTKAIIPVSLYGQCPDFTAINNVAARHGIPLIEDAAQSFGARQGEKRSCNLSRIACTSFFPSKPLGCYGDGGAVFTSDPDLAKAIRQIARHGQERRYLHTRIGVNSRLDTLQAAILLAKLEVFEAEIAARQAVAQMYAKELRARTNIAPPLTLPGNSSVWAQFTVRVPNRDKVAENLRKAGIPTAVHYPLPLHRQPAILDASCHAPASETAAAEVLSLPMHPYLSEADVAGIVQALAGAMAMG